MRNLLTTLSIIIFFIQPALSLGDQSLSSFSFSAPTQGQRLPVGKPFICEGNYTPKNLNTSGIHIWLFVQDGDLDGYYIQGPAIMLGDGSWEGKIQPGVGIIRLVAVQADDKANRIFASWMKDKKFGKQYELPKDSKRIATLKIQT